MRGDNLNNKMAVKYFNKQTQKWEIFPGTAGISAYEAAQEGGYKGTEEEFNAQIANFETILRKEVEITNSADDVHYPSSKAVKDYVDAIEHTEVVDNLATEDASKALSANQGKILNDTKLNKNTYEVDKVTFVTKNDLKNTIVNIPLGVINLISISSASDIVTAFGGEASFKNIYTKALAGNLLAIRNITESNTSAYILYSVDITSGLFKYYYVVDSTHYLHEITIDPSTNLPTSITVQKSQLEFLTE